MKTKRVRVTKKDLDLARGELANSKLYYEQVLVRLRAVADVALHAGVQFTATIDEAALVSVLVAQRDAALAAEEAARADARALRLQLDVLSPSRARTDTSYPSKDL